LQPISAIAVTSGSSASGVLSVVGNPPQPVATAIQPGSGGVQLIAQQPSRTSAVPVVLSQSAAVSRLVQPSVTAVSASPAGYYYYCYYYYNCTKNTL